MKTTNDYILEGGRIIDPASNTDEIRDLGISQGKICEPGKVKNPTRIRLNKNIVAPGFIDLHVHLRQPGRVDKETIKTGTMSAAAGGFTTIVAMPNTSPVADSSTTIEYLRAYAEREGLVKVLPAGAMTKGLEGKEMSGIGGLKKAGIVALTDDGKCVHNHELMRHILEYANSFGLPIFDHCEDELLSSNGVMHEGYWSVLLGLRGMPAASEELMVARDIILAEITNARIHIQHVSSSGTLKMIEDAKKRNLKITCEVTPHHISLTDEKIKTFDTNYKMNPPLRSEEHRQALIKGIKNGLIDAIATDHAPHTETEKLVEFDYAPFGVIGLETALPVCFNLLYHIEKMNIKDIIAKFTYGPAKILGMAELGTIQNDYPADLTILDINAEQTIDSTKFYSKSRNTPFDGMKLKGKVLATIVNGNFVFSNLPEIRGMI